MKKKKKKPSNGDEQRKKRGWGKWIGTAHNRYFHPHFDKKSGDTGTIVRKRTAYKSE